MGLLKDINENTTGLVTVRVDKETGDQLNLLRNAV